MPIQKMILWFLVQRVKKVISFHLYLDMLFVSTILTSTRYHESHVGISTTLSGWPGVRLTESNKAPIFVFFGFQIEEAVGSTINIRE